MMVRYKGLWIRIVSKPYEPERQTAEIAWYLIKNPEKTPQDAYRYWFAKEQTDASILYPVFRKENART